MGSIDHGLISDLYSTTSSDKKWGAILDRLHPILNAKSAGLVIVDKYKNDGDAPNQFGIASKSLDPEKLATYNKEFAKYEHDIVEISTNTPRWKMVVDPAFEDRDTISARPDVAYAIENFGIRDRFGVRLNDDPAWEDIIAFQYDISRGNATLEEFSQLVPYIPHIAQSIALGRMYDEIRKKCGAVLSMLDRVNIGMLLLKSDGTVIISNQNANETIENNHRLAISSNRKLTATGGQSNNLLHAISSIANSHSQVVNASKSHVMLGTDNDNDNLLIELTPLTDKYGDIGNSLVGVVALVVDPNNSFSLNEDGFQAVYSLTPAELEVANHVSDGHAYSEVANRRSVSRETVKKQVQSIFMKTKTSSRAGLIRRMMSISLPFRDE